MFYEIKQLLNCDHPTFELTPMASYEDGYKLNVPNGYKRYIIVEMVDANLIAKLQKQLMIDFLASCQVVSDDDIARLKQSICESSYEVW